MRACVCVEVDGRVFCIVDLVGVGTFCATNNLCDSKVLVFAQGSACFDTDNITQTTELVLVVCKVVLVRFDSLGTQ